MEGGIVKYAVKGLAGGIGLASESITARKNKKRTKSQDQSPGEPSRSRSVSTDKRYPLEEENDEEQWALDDAQNELLPVRSPPTSPGSPNKPITNVKILIDIFIQTHPLPYYADLAPMPRLPYPVVIPQRRPQNRSRGFIRAYAPCLINAGIDQTTFLDYLELFDKASQASPWLQTINLAGTAFSFLPSSISIAISVAIAISVRVAEEMQSRSRTTTFLDRLNAEFFRPRGLFCLVMTWNPESAATHNNVNILSTTISSASSPSSGTQRLRRQFQSSSGNTYGELEFPEVAPLIFPALETLGSEEGEHAVKTRDKLKKKREFVGSYWDKRAQAEYAAKNPGSMLAQGPKPEFTSRYADPNHPASNGNLISLVTGGYINPPSTRDTIQQRIGGLGGLGGRGGGLGGGLGGALGAIASIRDGGVAGLMNRQSGGRSEQYNDKGASGPPQRNPRDPYGGRGGGLAGGLGGLAGINPSDMLRGGVKKIMGKEVLYMMVVNMPSDEEMVVANRQADAAEREVQQLEMRSYELP